MITERKYRIDVEGGEGRLVNRNSSKPIPEDEPLFVLRAQDINSLPTLMAYLVLCEDLTHCAEVTKCIKDFQNFANQHPERMKHPDA